MAVSVISLSILARYCQMAYIHFLYMLSCTFEACMLLPFITDLSEHLCLTHCFYQLQQYRDTTATFLRRDWAIPLFLLHPIYSSKTTVHIVSMLEKYILYGII